MTRDAPAPEVKASRRPTAYDVARLARLSQSAVSRAFTPGASISEKTRLRVVEAARQLGYRPNLIARSLITQRSGLVAVAIARVEEQFFPAILEALSEAFAAVGYRVLLFTPGDTCNPDPILEDVLRSQVDAVILAATRLTSRFAEECSAARVPVVLLNRSIDNRTVSSVTGANIAGSRAIAAFLLAGGHRRFAYVAGLEDSSTSSEREQGYRRTLTEAGHTLAHRVVGHYDFGAAREAARALFEAKDRPDAVFCANDHTAFAVMETARCEYGLDVGREVSIVGFDDVLIASWPSFALTTYSQPVRPMARRVVDITLKLVEAGGGPAVHDIVPGELIVRTSARLPHALERGAPPI